MPDAPLIAFFPEASFGAALNCVGIARELQSRGARPVFICHPGFTGIFADYGFQEYHLPSTGPAQPADYWQAFIRRHLPHFNLSPIDQIETYVAPTWEAIVDTAIAAEAPLAALLARLRPDLIVLDNVVMFPAIARAACPWVRIISCAETELADETVPPYLSGLASDDRTGRAAFLQRYLKATAPAQDRYNRFRQSAGLAPLAPGQFLEPSPDLNLLLAPSVLRHDRATPLDPDQFTFLEGCVRHEGPYELPDFPRNEGPLIYVSFGSLGALDMGLMERMMATFATIPARFLVNAGALREAYRSVPDNVHLEGWYPQPSVVAMADLFIHHGGNNSFCEALYHGVPSLILPYCWDGHDNATRAEETGTGRRLNRADWTAASLSAAIRGLLSDDAMRARLKANARQMKAAPGVETAATLILKTAGAGSKALAPADHQRMARHEG
ncbi:glycosyltransferase [Frigidibacter sp. RF13]|uniref:glycosyltransferase n=1 Tax=Frigidibacter sp. RF13 TaxID=2997340 RepID=UPI00226E370B|nr:glycosyltransferase [Frigidibacter sp. RF13]MCY1126486.1 glycosyltransferase [Frigidibacter sp. RF13]